MQTDLFDKRREPTDILNEAVEIHQPTHVFALLSGGHDSLTAAHIASHHPRFSGCVHLRTGIGLRETRRFVKSVCDRFRWKLYEFHTPESYDDIVAESGFPGPGQHAMMYRRLKERALRHVRRQFQGKPGDRIALVSGVRKHESKRRMGNVASYIQHGCPARDGTISDGWQVWVNVIRDFTASDKAGYLRDNCLPQNPVNEILCMSGECLCGAMADPDGPQELAMLRKYFPDMGDRLDYLACVARRNGKPCQWGVRPEKESEDTGEVPLFMPMCHSCEAKHS